MALPQPVRAAAPWVLAIGAALALHLAVERSGEGFYNKLLADIGINVVLAVSLNLVNGFTGQFSIGHAGFMAVGGYVSGIVTYYGSILMWGSTALRGGMFGQGEWLFVVGCILGGLVAAALGYIVGLPSLRLRGDYLALVTLGFGEILRVLLQRSGDVVVGVNDAETAQLVAALPKAELPTLVGGSLGFNGLPFYTSLFWVWTAVAITMIVAVRLKQSSHGRAMLSIREDEIAAEAVGIPTTTIKVRAFVYAAFFAGIAGGLFAHLVGTTLNPRELGFARSFEIVIMVVLGGMGSVSGSALAAVALTVLPELLREFAQYRMPVYALTLIIIMLVRPRGLMGTREIWELPLFRRLRGSGAA